MASDLYPYKKILLENHYAICAIYEPHPFRKSALPVGAGFKISDDEWCWDYYDWCGNLIGMTDEEPEGKVVRFFTEESVGSKSLADYLNRVNPAFVRAWKEREESGKRPD